MTDLFAEQGITFDSAQVASSHPDGAAVSPSAGQPSLPKPDTQIPAQNDNTPIVSSAPRGNPNMSDDEKSKAMNDLYGDGAGGAETTPAAPPVPASTPELAPDNKPRDLFAEQGIAAPSVTEQNQNALTQGIPLPAPTDSDKGGFFSGFPAPISRAEMSMPDFGSHPSWQQQAGAEAAAQRDSFIKLGTQLYGPDQVNDWLSNPRTLGEGLSLAVSQGKTLPYVGGVTDAATRFRLSAIEQKNANGEEISDGDKQFVGDYIRNELESSIRGFTRGGKVAYTMSSIPAWIMEFAVADGAGKYIASAAEGATAATSLQSLSRIVGGTTRVAATSAFMPAQYVPAYAERRINATTAITDKGQMVMKDSTESPGMSALMAYGYTAADVASALVGPGINKYVVEPGTKLLSTPIIAASQALPARVRTGLYEAYKAIDPNASYSAIMTPNGWNSMLSALGSFQVDKILRGSLDYSADEKMSFSDAVKAMPLNEDDLLVAGGLAAIHGGISSASRITSVLMHNKGVAPADATTATTGMSALEKEDYVAKNINMPQSDIPDYRQQDVFTKESVDALGQTRAPTPEFFSNAQKQAAAMSDEQRNLSLRLLNQKMLTGIITPREMVEREAVASTIQKPIDQSTPATPDAAHYDSVVHPTPEAQLIAGQIDAMGGSNPPPINEPQSGFNLGWQHFKETHLLDIYAELANDLQPIENLSKKAKAAGAEIPRGSDTALTVSFTRSTPEWIRRNQLVDTTTWDANGNQVVTGKGLKPIYDDFDNAFVTTEPRLAQRHADFEDFLVARRLIEEANSGRDVLVTPEQKTKSIADLQRLSEKYGDNFQLFDTFANEIRDWDNRILHNLVTSGLKTQAWYDETVKTRQHYSPLNRVVEEDNQPSTITRAGIGKDVTPSRIGSLKQFKGSDKEIKNTFQSRLKNSALILQKSAVNKLRGDIAKFAQYYPEDVKVSNPAILREPVTISYDPKLREKLEHMIDFLGGSVERGKGKDLGLPRKALGAFMPAENLVKMRIGSTEGTLAHEAGHMLDHSIGLKERLLGDPQIKAQLQKLAEDRIGSTHELSEGVDGNHFQEEVNLSPKSYRDYIKNDDEVIANMFDAYVNSPEQLERVAPAAKAAFEKIIDENPQLAFLKEIKPSTNRATEEIESVLRDMRGPKNSLPVYIKGSRKYLELSDQMYKAFNDMTPIQMGMVERFLGGIFRTSKRVLQFGATSSPDFMIRHFYRAIGTSFLNTKGGAAGFLKHGFVDIPKAVFAVLGKTELYHEWASSSGALQTHMDLSDKGLAKMQKEIFSGNSLGKFLNPLNWLKTAKEVSDYAPRVAVFNKLKEQGASDLEAGLASLEATGNYIRHGSLVKRINQYAPFFNDMVQGGDRFVRSIARDPAGFTLRALATVTIPQLVLTGYYLYGADDKTRDEYLNLPEWRRSVSMNVKIGDKWIPLPRYFAPGFVFGALPEKMMIWAYGGNHPEIKNFWLSMMAETATSVSPVFDWTRAINPIVKSVLENITNYSFFMQRPLYSGDLQKTAPANQFNQYTSETAKMLGKLFNFSPTEIDNTIYDMSAKVGKYATQLSDQGINVARRAAGQPVNEKPTRATDNPIYGGLIEETPRGTGTQSFTEFREHMNEAAQAHNEMRELKGADAANFQHDNARLLAAYPQINAMQTQVNRLQKEIRDINRNTNISGNDKTDRINAISDQITRLVEGANLRYRAMTQSK